MKRFLALLLFVPLVANAVPDRPLGANASGHVQPAGQLHFDAISPKVKNHAGTGATETFNIADGNHHNRTLTQSTTLTLTGFTSGQRSWIVIRFVQDGTGGWPIVCPAEVLNCPLLDPLPNSITEVTFWSTDGGATILALPTYGTDFQIVNKSANYTLTAADNTIRHPSTDDNARTFTIPSNASVPFRPGKAYTFINEINVVTIAINSDTMTLQGANTTGSRTLDAGNTCTAVKVSATKWIITGSSGLTLYIFMPEWYCLLNA